MAASHLISVGEYLNSTYRPDVDYVDGRIEERNLGEFDHAAMQTRFILLLGTHEREWSIRVLTEVRVQISANRFRIPDVCIIASDAPRERILRHPPLLCVEVLSPRDNLAAMRRRVQDYFTIGVATCWILDPATRKAYICSAEAMTEQTTGVLRMENSPVEVSLEEAFTALD